MKSRKRQHSFVGKRELWDELFFIAIAFLVAVFMGWIITPQILLVAFRKRLFDSVGGRKTHSGIVPRLGGVVFVPVQCFLLVLSMFLCIN